MICFIRCGDYVWIGCTRNAEATVRAIRESMPYEAELLLTVERASEAGLRKIHETLKPYRHRDEWFSFARPVRELINRMAREEDAA